MLSYLPGYFLFGPSLKYPVELKLHRGGNHSMVERTSYYARNNGVTNLFSKHYLNMLRHFRTIFEAIAHCYGVITPLLRPFLLQAYEFLRPE